jgi:hypothetical protein
MTIYSIYKKNHSVTPKEAENVHDLGYLGVERIPRNKDHHCLAERGKIKSYLQKKKNTTKVIL